LGCFARSSRIARIAHTHKKIPAHPAIRKFFKIFSLILLKKFQENIEKIFTGFSRPALVKPVPKSSADAGNPP
jgi:hypothetical protein